MQQGCLAWSHPAPYIADMLRRLAALIALFWAGSIGSAHAQSSAGAGTNSQQVHSRGYPSLLRRPVESRNRDAETAKALAEQPVAKPLDAAVLAELSRLNAQAAAAAQGFERNFAASDRVVASAGGAPVASESWISAQEAISVLDAGRYDSVTALASLDSIYVAQLNAGGDASMVAGYRTPVLAMVDAQNDRLDSLRFRLARP
ncbi:hypothetical protein BH10PSE13_BH10PSE13_13890 [soil metagenome]